MIIVSVEDMKTAALNLRQGKEEIEAKLRDLSAMIENLLETGYVADKGTPAFRETFTQYISGQHSSAQALDGLATYLESTADAYEAVNQASGRGQ
jgi:uncharacterized protein YukE